jgi:AraC family transcriptional regulator
MDIRIENWPATRIAYVAAKGPYNVVISQSFNVLMAYAGQKNLWSFPGAKTLAVTHDDPGSVPATDLRSEAAIVVAPDFASDHPKVQVRTMPAGRYAVATYIGPYAGLPAAWGEVCGKLIPAAGLRNRDGECFEIYVNDCGQVKPEDLRTDIYAPIE